MAEPYKPYDVTTKQLIESDPLAWLRLVGLSGEAVELISADLATVVADADRIVRVTNPDYLAHLEAQSVYKVDMGDRTLMYNVLSHYKHRLPVISIVILLRKEADGPAMTGRVQYGTLDFAYIVVRLWELPVQDLLAAPLALLPFAPLSDLSGLEMPSVVKRMEARIETEAPVEMHGFLWTATMFLMGLKFETEQTNEWLKGVQGMKESATYQALLEEGRVEGRIEGEIQGEKDALLRIGTKRFGEPTLQTRQFLAAITSKERIEQLIDRAIEVESWDELLS